MATLTNTVRISGNVKGKSINYQHTYTIEGVLEASLYSADGNISSGILKTSAGGAGNTDAVLRPPAIAFLHVINTSQYPSALGLRGTGGIALDLYLLQNQFVIMSDGGAGMFHARVAATGALLDCTNANSGVSTPTGFIAPLTVMAAAKASS